MINFDELIRISSPRFVYSRLWDIINDFLPYLLGIMGFILLGLLVWGGYDVLLSQGDPKKVASGKDRITYAILGFIIIFIAYWFLWIIAITLNISDLIG